MRDAVWETPYSMRACRFNVGTWVVALALALFGMSMALARYVFHDDFWWFSITLNALCIVLDVAMVRFYLRKLRKEKARIAREKWIHAMFVEWTR